MTFMQQIEITSVNEKLKLLVDYNTAAKLMKDKDYLRQYVENLQKVGILRTKSGKESGVTKQDEANKATKQKSNTSNRNSEKKKVTATKETCTATSNKDGAQNTRNQKGASGLVIINEKEKQKSQNLEKGLTNQAPEVFSGHKNQTVVSSQNSRGNDSSVDDNDSNTAEWSHNATLLLVSKRLEMENEFQKPVQKNRLWTKISNTMKENGYNFSSSECHTKWRNMLCTYRKNVERSKQSGSGNIRWEYYSMIHEVYRKKLKETNPPEALQTSSNISPTCSGVEEPTTDIYSPTIQERSSPSEDLFVQAPSYKRKRNYEEPPEWFKEFLERREEEKRKREELDEKRWQHLAELENKKIEVMHELTNVLQKFLEK